MQNRSKNKELDTQLEETKSRLDTLYRKNPYPSRSNIALAKAELDRVRKEVGAAKGSFKPIPFQNVADKDFHNLLETTIFELQERARQIGIELPEKDYAFSFKAQKSSLTFAPGSFPTLPEQLAEIKTVCDILFDAKINRLANVKRMRITVDDPAGSADYHEADYQTVTNDLTHTVSNPYEVTFHSFSAELAAALQGFYKSPYGIIVKSLAVEPAPEVQLPPGQPRNPIFLPRPGVPPPGAAVPAVPQQQPGAIQPGAVLPRPVPRAGGPAQKEVLQTILNEKLLKITLFIEVIKPLK
jgi:hypothetical protein